MCETRWGKDGYQQIQDMLCDIDNLNNEINRVLDKTWQELEPRARPQSNWKHNLQQKLRRDGESRSKDSEAIEKLLTTVFKVKYLDKNIERLRKRVENLETFTRRTYWLRSVQNHVKQIAPQDVRSADLEDKSLECLEVAMNKLYHDRTEAQENYMLVLGSPLLKHGWEALRYRPNCQVEFIVLYGNHFRLITVDIDLKPGPSIPNLQDQKLTELPHLRPGLPIEALLMSFKRSTLHGQVRLALAKVAKRVAYSGPLHNTLWTANFCGHCVEARGELCAYRHSEERFALHSKQATNNLYNFGLILVQVGVCELDMCELYDEEDEYFLCSRVFKKVGIRYADTIETCLDMGKLKYGCRAEHVGRAFELVVKP